MKYGYRNWSRGISAFVLALVILTSGPLAQITVIISPSEVTLSPKGNIVFGARVKEGKKLLDLPITWKAQGGVINAAGLYTAPTVAGQYQVTATATGAAGAIDTATVTVDPNLVPAYRLTSPNKGETFRVGDTVNIIWESDMSQINDAGLSATLDGGVTMEAMWDGSIIPEHDYWADVKWVVPAEMGGVSLGGKQLIIQVHEYYGGEFDNIDLPINIVAADAVIKRRFRENLLRFPAQNRIRVNSSNPYRITISSLSGREQYEYRNSSPYTLMLRQIGLAEGVYVVRLETGGSVITKTLPYLKAD